MRKALQRSAIAAAASVLLHAYPAFGAGAALTIEAEGFAGAAGHAVARIYAAGDDVLGEPRWSARAGIVNGQARFTEILPPGRYAVVVYHDQNDNGSLDHNVLGLPAEPLGFSGGFALSLFSGPPSFSKLRFELPQAGTIVRVQVR